MIYDVEVFLDDCEEAREARVLSVIKKPKSKWRPVALDTVELEKLAVRKLKFSAKETMLVAERLYNKGVFLHCLFRGIKSLFSEILFPNMTI